LDHRCHVELLERYPDGIAEKYRGRLRQEVERSYGKVAAGTGPAAGAAPAASTSPAGMGAAGTASSAPASAPHHVIPTIRLSPGNLPEIAAQIARALIANGAPIFVRSGTLVEPVTETTAAADGRKTVTAKLSPP
jgi:hypothetical protein